MAKKAAKKATKRKTRKKAEPASRGLSTEEVQGAAVPVAMEDLVGAIEDDGGRVVGTYRDPLGGAWQCIAALPIAAVEPTPFQRDLSKAHADRLTARIDELGRFLDPIVAVRHAPGTYWTPNGHHRLAAMRALGARSIVALVVPEEEIAYRILSLNTEKAHNLKEKALEVIRMARGLAELDSTPEKDYAGIFEEPPLLTLGACYEERARFSGSAYNPVLKRVDGFLDAPMAEALAVREARAKQLLEIDDAVAAAVKDLKDRGFDSPYLKAFVVARVNPVRFTKGDPPEYDATLAKMLEKARAFDGGKVSQDQVARSGGAPDE